MKKITKILATTGTVSALGIGVAGIAFGAVLSADKTKNAQIVDHGDVSLLTKHLFNVPQKDYKTLDEVAENNAQGKKGINILNIGDSVTHGDYTWQILDKIREEGNEHYLKDGPPRIGSFYGFLVDALRKNNKLPKDYHINYDNSVSGLRMFELLKWFKAGKYMPLTDELNSKNIRKDNPTAVDHLHNEVNDYKMVDQIKTSDVVTMSIGGNDLIRCIKLFGKHFYDSFDTSTYGDKLKTALKDKKYGDIISIDMDSLSDILKEMEENLQGILQMVHQINPNTKVMLFETAFPFIHYPKIIRNAMAPLYSKVKEMTKRVMKINVTKNDGISKDVHGNVHATYEQTEIDTDSENHKAGEIIQSKTEQENSGLNWASYTSIDYTGSKKGDPDDVYKANSLDIHPTIEGQGKIAQAMLKTMQEKFGLTIPKDGYTQDDVDKRVKFVRELHQGAPNTTKGKEGEYQQLSPEQYKDKVKELNTKYYPGLPDIEQEHISDDAVYDVPSDVVDEDGHVTTGIQQEKDKNEFYTITRTLFGAIDAFTDRVYLNDDLAFKKLDYSGSDLKSYDEYKSKISDFEHASSYIYSEYSTSLDLTKPENKKYKGAGGIAIKLWTNEATNWLINIADKGKTDSEYQALTKDFGFEFDTYAPAIKAYKDARTLMLAQRSKWDMDEDGRFTLSDIQLGDVSSLKLDGAITGLGGLIDQITSWTDFNIMWTRAFTNSFTGAALTRPDYSDKSVLGRVTLSSEEMYQTHLVSGSGHFDLVNGIGVDPSSEEYKDSLDKNGEVKLGQRDSTINRLKTLLHFLSNNEDIGTTISDFINDHVDDLKDWLQDAIDFVKDLKIAANKNVVFDFMENLMGDFGTVNELIECAQKLLEDPNIAKLIDPILVEKGIKDPLGDISLLKSVAKLDTPDGILTSASVDEILGLVNDMVLKPITDNLAKMTDEDAKEKFGKLFAEYTQILMDKMFSPQENAKPLDTKAMLKEFGNKLLKIIDDNGLHNFVWSKFEGPIKSALDAM